VAEEIKRVQLEFGRNAAIELTYGYERHDKAFISIGYMNRETRPTSQSILGH